MALLFETLDALTRSDIIPQVVTQIFLSHPFLDKMLKGGRVREGGTSFEQPIEYGKQGVGGTYAGAQILRMEQKEFITRMRVMRRKYYQTIIVTEDEDMQNRGTPAVASLIAAKEKNAMRSIQDDMAYGIFDDGTKDYGNGETNGFEGLKLAVSSSATTYAYIAESDMADWANKRQNANSAQLSTAMMLDMEMDCTDGNDAPDLILTTKNLWKKYRQLLEPAQRQTMGQRVGNWGNRALEFSGIPVVWDNFCPAGYMYYINTTYMDLLYERGYFFNRSPYRQPHNQKVRVADITFVGNLFCNRRNRQGVIYGISES